MKTVTVYKRDGSEAGTIDLPEEIFGIEPSMTAIYQVVKAILANRRQGNASTKSRSEVNVTKSKPYRQKGSGRARAGSANSPLWVGGGVAFGPKPRSHKQKLNKKLKHLGFTSVCSIKAQEDKIKVVEDFTLDAPKTKDISNLLAALGITEGKTFFLLKEKDDILNKSSRNIPRLNVCMAENANTYDVMNSDTLLLTKSAVERMKEVFTG